MMQRLIRIVLSIGLLCGLLGIAPMSQAAQAADDQVASVAASTQTGALAAPSGVTIPVTTPSWCVDTDRNWRDLVPANEGIRRIKVLVRSALTGQFSVRYVYGTSVFCIRVSKTDPDKMAVEGDAFFISRSPGRTSVTSIDSVVRIDDNDGNVRVVARKGAKAGQWAHYGAPMTMRCEPDDACTIGTAHKLSRRYGMRAALLYSKTWVSGVRQEGVYA